MLPLTFHWALKIKVEDKYPKALKSSKGFLLNEIINCYYICKEKNSPCYTSLQRGIEPKWIVSQRGVTLLLDRILLALLDSWPCYVLLLKYFYATKYEAIYLDDFRMNQFYF